MRESLHQKESGFTLIELLVAMTIFSFMLVIVLFGFINVVHLHNQALAANATQDSARTAINELVRAVRDSTGVASVTPPGPTGLAGTLCLNTQNGYQSGYYIGTGASAGLLMRSDNCTAPRVNPQAITGSVVKVVNFSASQDSFGATITKPEIMVTVTIASANGTTSGVGTSTVCNNNNADRTFCSTITLTSGAVPR